MYLHEVADMEVSFTKDDMHKGRHADYERRLAEQVLNCTVDQKHHRRSPKLKQRDQQTTDGDAPAHRQSRNHNAPPRHRNKQTFVLFLPTITVEFVCTGVLGDQPKLLV